MPGGFSFDLDAMRARDEINDALSVMKTGAPPMPRLPMPQMGMPQPQMPPMQPQMAQMRPQMAQMQPQMAQMGAQMGQMRPQMPQMGAPLGQMGAMRPPMAPQMGPPLRFKRGGHVSGDDFAVKRDEYASGGGAWTRKEGKNPEGGLNAKGRASLKAQGQDIKPPVSAKQAAKSPKSAARRKSFCARMGGMEGPMKDEKGRPTRKALALRKWDCKAQGGMVEGYAEGGESRVNEAGNYTKPGMRKSLFNSIKAGGKGGAPGQWSARKAQMLAREYKAKGGGYRD
jgi:hypothetical protein